MDGGAEGRADTLTACVWNLLGRVRNPRTDAGADARRDGERGRRRRDRAGRRRCAAARPVPRRSRARGVGPMMAMMGIRLHPVDTWFFRDGTPFTLDSAPQENVDSLFPPHPPTVVGALRAALAYANGWNGAVPWPPPHSRSPRRRPGPRCAAILRPVRAAQRAAAVPRPAARAGYEERPGRLGPGRLPPSRSPRDMRPSATTSGSPKQPLPNRIRGDSTRATGQWLTQGGMNAVLLGGCPSTSEVVSSECLWNAEPADRPRARQRGSHRAGRHALQHTGMCARVAASRSACASPARRPIGSPRSAGCRRSVARADSRNVGNGRPTSSSTPAWIGTHLLDRIVDAPRGRARRVVAPRHRRGAPPREGVRRDRRRPRGLRVPGPSAAHRRLGFARAAPVAASVRAAARQHAVLRATRPRALRRCG